jgi:hypothetical protein
LLQQDVITINITKFITQTLNYFLKRSISWFH